MDSRDRAIIRAQEEKDKAANYFGPTATRERQLWDNIHTKAQIDPGLQDLLNKCIMYYRLLEKKDSGGNDGGG